MVGASRLGPARMLITVEHGHDGRTVICWPIGDLDRFTFADFVSQISSLIRPGMHLVLDLSDLGVVDSTGLGALRAVTRRVRRRGGRVVVQNASRHVAELLSLIGLDVVRKVGRLSCRSMSPRQPAS
jgi:anti-anti-sigma factor